MFVLMTDETNVQPSNNAKFFIYGGLFFPVEVLVKLDSKIQEIRDTYNYRPEDQLKFDTHSRPDHVSFEDATRAQNEVLDACIKLNCKFIGYMILHDILKNQTFETQFDYAINSVISSFHKFLTEANGNGICLVDRLPTKNPFGLLSDKFTKGLEFPNRDSFRTEKIKLFGAICCNASHASSAMDIVLGAFRYCANNPINEEVTQVLINKVGKLIWAKDINGELNVLDYGLIQRPDDIEVKEYKQEYDRFIDDMNELLEKKWLKKLAELVG